MKKTFERHEKEKNEKRLTRLAWGEIALVTFIIIYRIEINKFAVGILVVGGIIYLLGNWLVENFQSEDFSYSVEKRNSLIIFEFFDDDKRSVSAKCKIEVIYEYYIILKDEFSVITVPYDEQVFNYLNDLIEN